MPQLGEEVCISIDPLKEYTGPDGLTEPLDGRVVGYSWRRGDTWTFGKPLDCVSGPCTSIRTRDWCVGTEDFWVRAMLDTGHYTRATSVEVTTTAPTTHSNASNRNEVSLSWPGSKSNTTTSGTDLVLSAGQTTGTYTSPEIDLGSETTWRIGIMMHMACANTTFKTAGDSFTDIDGMTVAELREQYGTYRYRHPTAPLIQDTDINGNNIYAPTASWELDCAVYTSPGAPGTLKPHTPGEYYGRYLQFTITLTRTDTTDEAVTVGTCLTSWSQPPTASTSTTLGGLSDVTITSVSDGEVLAYDLASGDWVNATVTGTGDVVGPSSSVDQQLVRFDGTTGKLVEDSGIHASIDSTTNMSLAIGHDLADVTSDKHTIAIGIEAGKGMTGDAATYGYCTFLGEAAGNANDGVSVIGIGMNALDSNTGWLCVAVGSNAGRDNTYASHPTGAGPQYLSVLGHNAGRSNLGDFCSGVGGYSLHYNKGEESSGIGWRSLFRNLGDYCASVGFQAGEDNPGDKCTALGAYSFRGFVEDTANEVSFDSSDVTAGPPVTFTVTSHGLGSTGDFLHLRFEEGSGTLTGFDDQEVMLVEVTDANTLTLLVASEDAPGGPFGSATGHKLIPRTIYSNSTAVGYAAEPDASNQVMLGDTNVTNVKTAGTLTTKGATIDLSGGTATDIVATVDGTNYTSIAQSGISHMLIDDTGIYDHDTIDTHLVNTTHHFTEASIDHTAIQNVGTNSHAQIDTHLADGDKHREINDSGTDITDLWSASKIGNELAAKADDADLTSHTGASASVHGVTGDVVGTSGAQTIADKTLETPRLKSANVTLSSGLASVSGASASFLTLEAEAGTTDTLDALTGGEPDEIIIIGAASGDTITVAHNSGVADGDIMLKGSATVDMSGHEKIMLIGIDIGSGNVEWHEIGGA